MIDQTVGHYRITAKLGAGGMGEVYLAEDTSLDRKVALKILPLEVADDAARRQRFVKEAKAASALNHPHVCVIYEVGETPERHLFIAMEFVEGQALDTLVRQGALPIGQVVDIGIQTADALDAAHTKGIVHRDIKPANIILNERGVKVLDFGLAKRVGHDDVEQTRDLSQTRSGQIIGTPTHMSPEQALGKTVDYRTDLFSLGVVLYELVTGRKPFTGANIGETIHNVVNAQPKAIARFNYEVTPELERIIRKCLQKADLGRREWIYFLAQKGDHTLGIAVQQQRHIENGAHADSFLKLADVRVFGVEQRKHVGVMDRLAVEHGATGNDGPL